jgi:hypothetical protein
MQPALGQNQALHCLIGALRKVVGAMAARSQAFDSFELIALQMLVPSLAANAKLLTELGDGKSPALSERGESDYLIVLGDLVPGHGARYV